jgi:hypothetical protein
MKSMNKDWNDLAAMSGSLSLTTISNSVKTGILILRERERVLRNPERNLEKLMSTS